MVEEIVKNYLKKELDCPVYMEEEPGMPEEYILVEKTGGGGSDGINRATITVQSYSRSLYGAAKLNETVKEAMNGITNLDDICRCELNSDYNLTDIERKKHRYQAVYDIIHY